MSVTTDSQTVAGTYVVDPTHSSIGFTVRHAMVTKVRGTFDEFEGSGYFNPETPADSRVNLTIQAKSINTRNADRDAHLRTNDFFDMERYPELRFESTSVKGLDGDRYAVTGDLTIKDVTKAVIIEFESTGSAVDPYGNQRLGFEGRTTINRKDWGITWNAALETGGVVVSEKVNLEFDVSAIKTEG